MPRTKHEKENIDGHILEINRILGAISKNGLFIPSPSLIPYKKLIAPRFFHNFKNRNLWTSGQTRVRPARTPLPDRGDLLEQR